MNLLVMVAAVRLQLGSWKTKRREENNGNHHYHI